MRLSRNTLHMAVAAVALGSGLAGAASAGLVYDLRFADGSHTKDAVAGQTYPVQLWAKLTGTDTVDNEGIQYSLIKALSTETNGGAWTDAAGGLKDGVQTIFIPSGARNGAGSDLNGDGVGDWGGTGADQTDTNYMFARSAVVVTGALGQGTVIPGGREFQLATFNIQAGQSIGLGKTSFNIVKPDATTNGATAATYASYQVDGVSAIDLNNTNAASSGVYANSLGVTLNGVVPEPASLGLLGLGALGLIRRRRA